MQSEKSAFGNPRALLLFRNKAAAERLIAGVAAAARAAVSLARTGVKEIWLGLEAGGIISRSAMEDMRRACPGCVLHFGIITGLPVHRGEQLVPAGRDAAATRRILRETAKDSDGVVSKWLNRPLSRLLSSWFLQIPGFRPGHATAGTALIAIAMGFFLVFGGRAGLLWGGLLFHAASVFDGVDGEVARATYRTSARGAVLDSLVDMATNILFYLGLTISLTRLIGPREAMVGGWAVAAGLTGMVILGWLSRQVGEAGNFDILKRFYRDKWQSGVPRRIVDTLVTITSRDFFAAGSAFLIAIRRPELVTLGLAGFASLWVVLILLALPSLLRGGREADLVFEQGASLP